MALFAVRVIILVSCFRTVQTRKYLYHDSFANNCYPSFKIDIESALRDMLRLEKSLDEGLDQLKARLQELRPELDLSEAAEDDDVESIASSTVHTHAQYTNGGRFVRFTASSASAREVERLQNNLSRAEEENRHLRQEAKELRDILTRSGVRLEDYDLALTAVARDPKANFVDEKESDGSSRGLSVPAMIHSEGGVFNLVRNQQNGEH
jgi:cell shape-determining protein MreC